MASLHARGKLLFFIYLQYSAKYKPTKIECISRFPNVGHMIMCSTELPLKFLLHIHLSHNRNKKTKGRFSCDQNMTYTTKT